MATTTAYMSLTKWAATDKFDYTQLATNWTIIDGHDHSTVGKQINGATGIQLGSITSANIANGTITPDDLAFTAIPAYRANTYALSTTISSYSTGTIQLFGTGAVTGTGTNFTSAMVGATLSAGSVNYLITGFTDSTHISVANSNSNTLVAGTSFSISYTLQNGTSIVTDAPYVSWNTNNRTIASSGVTPSNPSSGKVKYTTSGAHGLRVGQTVTISGITGGSPEGGYNGTFVVDAVQDSTNFSVSNSTTTNSVAATTLLTGAGVSTVTTIGSEVFTYNPSSISGNIDWDYVGGGFISGTGRGEGTNTNLSTTYNNSFAISNVAPATPSVALSTSVTVSAASVGSGSYTGKVQYVTSSAHNFSVGQVVTIAGITGGSPSGGFSGTFTITDITDGTRFYVTNTTTGTPTIGTATAIIYASYVTYTTSSNHNLVPGQTVLISNIATTTAYNGTYTVFATPTATTFVIQSSVTGTAGLGSSPTVTLPYGVASIILPYRGDYMIETSADVYFGSTVSQTFTGNATNVAAGKYLDATSTGFVTYTIGSHSVLPGNTITVTGLATVTAYNVTNAYVVAVDSTRVVIQSATTGTPTGTGTVTYFPTQTISLNASQGVPSSDTTATTATDNGIVNSSYYNPLVQKRAVVNTGASATISSSSGAVASSPTTGSVTYTTTLAHNFYIGQTVTITGIGETSPTGGSYNGTYRVTSIPTSTTFVVSNPVTGGSPTFASSPTATSPSAIYGLFGKASTATASPAAIKNWQISATPITVSS